eukprot:3125374-Amphidinium_carterae.1
MVNRYHKQSEATLCLTWPPTCDLGPGGTDRLHVACATGLGREASCWESVWHARTGPAWRTWAHRSALMASTPCARTASVPKVDFSGLSVYWD